MRSKKTPRYMKNFHAKIKYDLAAVLKRIKPSYLWDTIAVSGEEVHECASLAISRKYGSECTKTPSELYVLHLFDDYLIGDLRHTLDHLGGVIQAEKSTVNLVDISRSKPQLVDLPYPRPFRKMVRSLIKQLEEFDVCTRDTTHGPPWKIQTDQYWNISTAFGLLLGFPVVYWYSDQEAHQNSLSMVPLKVYSVTCRKDDLIGEGQAESGLEETHEIYSFSFPDEFSNVLDEQVEVWFQKLKGRHGDLPLKLKHRVAQYPVVTL